MKPPKYPVAAATLDDMPKPQRAQQEQPTRHYRDDAALPFYERHPEWRPKPLSSRRRRRQLIREGF